MDSGDYLKHLIQFHLKYETANKINHKINYNETYISTKTMKQRNLYNVIQ